MDTSTLSPTFPVPTLRREDEKIRDFKALLRAPCESRPDSLGSNRETRPFSREEGCDRGVECEGVRFLGPSSVSGCSTGPASVGHAPR